MCKLNKDEGLNNKGEFLTKLHRENNWSLREGGTLNLWLRLVRASGLGEEPILVCFFSFFLGALLVHVKKRKGREGKEKKKSSVWKFQDTQG